MSEAMRVPALADAAAVADLVNRDAPEPVTEEIVRRMWSSPTFELEHDARIERRGYAAVESLGQDRAWIALHGEPSDKLVDWAESRARLAGSRLFSGGWSSNAHVLGTLDRRGYRLIRQAQDMVIDLARPVSTPSWPDGVAVQSLQAGDERMFYDVHQDAFVDMWEPVSETYEEWTYRLVDAPAFDPGLWFAAVAGGEPVGIAICKVRAADADTGWVDILGVRRPWRRRGVARCLLLHALGVFRERGLRRAGLGVDSESITGAHRLYESVGMTVSGRFVIVEKAAS